MLKEGKAAKGQLEKAEAAVERAVTGRGGGGEGSGWLWQASGQGVVTVGVALSHIRAWGSLNTAICASGSTGFHKSQYT